jgi:superkiller protein 3
MYDEAITAYKKAIEINPQYTNAHYYLGIAYYYGKKMYDEAITAYKKAIEINPQYTNAHYYLGIAYRKKGMNDEAIGAYEKAIELSPQYTEAHNELGIAYYSKKMYDEAITAYQKAIELNPQYTSAYSNLGLAYRSKEMYDKAIAAYKKAIEINPEYTLAHNGLGLAYYNKGMYDAAIAAYQKAIETNANYSGAHNNLAKAYYEKGEYGLAAEHRDRAVELGYKVDPEFSQRLDNAQKTLEQPVKTTKKPESTSTPSLINDIAKSFNKAVEFVKFLDEAKNSFLNEDYQEAQTFLDEARKILDSHLQTTPKPAVFFDLSTPENALRSFLEASLLNDEETARKCWSEKVPDYLVSLTIEGFQEKTDQDSRPEDELIKLVIGTFRYQRQWTGANSYYVWAIAPGEERSEDMQFIVVREEGVWKILGFKVWEEEDFFKALIQ